MQKLTTPEMKESESVFPGENWFFYWKTSPSLWESKLREYAGPGPIFVPINWALHSEYLNTFDFGDNKPETDLKRLVDVANSTGHEVVFLLAISPVPFLANGGLPAYLARNIAINKDNLAMTTLNNEEKVNRMYSYYSPEVFQAHRKFCQHFGSYLSQSGTKAPVYALNSMRLEDQYIVSYFKDHSQTFEKGFLQYLSQLDETEPAKIEQIKTRPEYINELKNDYSKVISDLYVGSIKEFVAGHYKSKIDVCFLGGGTKDLFSRASDKWDAESLYFEPLMRSITKGYYPSSVLLEAKRKSGPLAKALNNNCHRDFIQSYLQTNMIDEDTSLSFQHLVLFEIFDEGTSYFDLEVYLNECSLKSFFDKDFRWAYKLSHRVPEHIDDLNLDSLHFFIGNRLNEESFKKLLKLFMTGVNIFLDMSGLNQKLLNRLSVFITENNLTQEKINYVCPVSKISLGEGHLITFEASKLAESSDSKRKEFWLKMIDYLDVKHLDVNAEEGIEYAWMKRASNPYELSYSEIRRINIYNPTSYKRKVTIAPNKSFAFIRTLDEVNVELKSSQSGVELKLLPGSSVTLDYGYFES